ncbi:MAG: enolase C-terminal domain-like protein [Dehalococcoidia bacterium]
MTSAVIRRVSWQGFAVPFRTPFASSRETFARREGLLVFIETTGGSIGLGEASPLPGSGSGLKQTMAAVEALARRAIGKAPAGAWHSLACEPVGRHRATVAAARFAVETAVAGLAAQAEGMPLGTWLAARLDLPAPSRSIPVNAVIGEGSPAHVRAAVLERARQGFTTFKLKVGGDPAIDAARVAEARHALGPGAELRVDANQAWTFDEAFAFFGMVAQHAISLCEEPIQPGPGHLQQLARLRAATETRIAVDESCPDTAALQAVIDATAAGAVIIKPAVAGLRESLRMLELARRADLATIVTSAFESGVGLSAAAHVASLLPAPQPACGLATLDFIEDDLIVDPPLLASGALHLPGRAGLGVTCDQAALARFATALRGSVE